ncbi:hypothetical protein PLESTF_001001400 [Pleodorina starrii]|nr:hypothetical protein PLESTF_001001400 [Pleodorina starrii]
MVRRQQAPPLGPSVLYNPLHSSASAGSGAQDNEGGTNLAPQMFHTNFADNEPENAGTKCICREVFGSVLSEGQLERLLVPVFELTGWEAPMRVPGLADAGFEVWVHSHVQLVYTLILAVRQVLSLPSVRTEVMGALYEVLIDMSDTLGQGMPMEGE